LTADVSHAGLGDQELLEGSEGGVFADDLLRGVHGVGKLVGVPGDRLRGLDQLTIEALDLANLGGISFIQQSLHSERMTFGSAEAEGVGQVPLEGFPELLSLGILKGYDGIVVSLESLVLLDDGGV
jgi:hypothetical protein